MKIFIKKHTNNDNNDNDDDDVCVCVGGGDTYFVINVVRYCGLSMVIRCLVGQESNFVTNSMIHDKAVQFSQHGAFVVKLEHFSYNPGCIILAALQSIDVGLFHRI